MEGKGAAWRKCHGAAPCSRPAGQIALSCKAKPTSYIRVRTQVVRCAMRGGALCGRCKCKDVPTVKTRNIITAKKNVSSAASDQRCALQLKSCASKAGRGKAQVGVGVVARRVQAARSCTCTVGSAAPSDQPVPQSSLASNVIYVDLAAPGACRP